MINNSSHADDILASIFTYFLMDLIQFIHQLLLAFVLNVACVQGALVSSQRVVGRKALVEDAHFRAKERSEHPLDGVGLVGHVLMNSLELALTLRLVMEFKHIIHQQCLVFVHDPHHSVQVPVGFNLALLHTPLIIGLVPSARLFKLWLP